MNSTVSTIVGVYGANERIRRERSAVFANPRTFRKTREFCTNRKDARVSSIFFFIVLSSVNVTFMKGKDEKKNNNSNNSK